MATSKSKKTSSKKSSAKKSSAKNTPAKKPAAKKPAAKKAPAKKKAPPKKAATGRKVIIGVLTDEGVECQAMRQDRTKKLFTLVPPSKLTGFNNGDRVRVTGRVQEISFCQQGTTIAIDTITKVP